MIPTLNRLKCVPGHFLCKFADNHTYLCYECVDRDHYWINIIENTCVSRDHYFDDCKIRSVNADTCLKCITEPGYILNSESKCKLVEHCLISDGISACLRCLSNFALMQG